MSRHPGVGLALLLVLAAGAFAQDSLLYFELQGVAGYSTGEAKAIFHSLSADEAMQKSSLGFDYLLRIRGRSRDLGVLAIQARAAYDPDGDPKAELQLYNAFVRLKTGLADLWAGHGRPALGLSSVLDSHALLLPTLSMLGYGFDRDWGAGLLKDFPWGDAAVSLTAGSGMPLRLDGNFLASARIAKGVLVRDNYSLGLSAAAGNVIDVMGHHGMSDEPMAFRGVSADLTYLRDNLENRAEVFVGRKGGRDVLALFWRIGVNLLEEGRLKLEAQPVLMRSGSEWTSLLSACASLQVTGDLALRSMAQYDRRARSARLVVQAYYSKAI